jgi:malonyl-CoA/methylmalonyl-CoA synthetase
MLSRAFRNADRLAVLDAHGAHTYGQLNGWAAALASQLREAVARRPPTDGRQPRVAYMCPRDHTYVAAKLGSWQAGAIGVPIAENYPTAEIQYVLQDSGASACIVHKSFLAALGPAASALGVPVVAVDNGLAGGLLSESVGSAPSQGDGAMLIYTSGTTGRPKGVLVRHSMLEAQVGAMSQAWGWSGADHIVNVLPLHHVHGVVAVLLTAVWNGAVCEMLPKFDAAATWAALTRGRAAAAAAGGRPSPTLFMAVPTVYARLVELYDKSPKEVQEKWSASLKSADSPIRLMVSGSAALPETLALRWTEISGHRLLERYGMTEFSMAISNPLVGERKLNSVGLPLPGYEARIVPEADDAAAAAAAGGSAAFVGPGELQIRGPGVFNEYWGKPEATKETFAEDGWFKTGDCAQLDAGGYVNILGRMSADIIKSGGYKISALDIERVLLAHPDIAEIAVMGSPDPVYGERVAAAVVLKTPADDAVAAAAALGAGVKVWAKELLAPYKIPSVWRVLAEMPRNAMGKVNKKELRKNLFG